MNNKNFYFVYETKLNMPNGDPDTGEQRIDLVNNRAVISDLRVKRHIRDGLAKFGYDVFYEYDANLIKRALSKKGSKDLSGAAAKFQYILNKKNIDENKLENIKDFLLENFIDLRLFGGILTSKTHKANVDGAIQFHAESYSINEIDLDNQNGNIVNRGITSIFPSTIANTQGSMGSDNFLKYGLFISPATFSMETAIENKINDSDLELMYYTWWHRLSTLNSRSKQGHAPIGIIIIDGAKPMINKKTEKTIYGGFMDINFSPINVNSKLNSTEWRSFNDYEINLEPLKSLDRDVTIIGDDRISNIVNNTNFIHINTLKEKFFKNL